MRFPRRALAAIPLLLVAPLLGSVPVAHAAANFPGPVITVQTGDIHLSSPTVADVNGDGVKDIAIGSLDGLLRIINGATGAYLPGWPQPVQPRAGRTTAVESSPTIADLDKDGRPEIIVGAGSVDPGTSNQPGGVVVFNADGSVRWRFETQDTYNQWTGGGPDGYGDGVVGTPAVGDVDGDGFPDVVFGSFDHFVYAKSRDGANLGGFPFNNADTIWSSPALYDNDGDGRVEIYIGTDASGYQGCTGGFVRAIRYVGGAQNFWSVCKSEIFQSSPAIGDIDGDGRMELVIGAGYFYKNADSNRVFAFHLDDGSAVPGWPQSTNGPVFGSPVIGDVTGDGAPEVVVAACGPCSPSTTGRVWAWHGNGQHVWDVNPGAQEGNTSEMISTPVLADLNGDRVNDVAVGMGGAFFLMNGPDGSRLYNPVSGARAHQNSAAVADFGGSVGWRLVVASRLLGQPGLVNVYPLPTAPGTPPPWPQWRKAADHVGAPPSTATVKPATAGYWLVASDGGIFAFGNAPFLGSTGNIRLSKPIVGMARTPSGGGYWLVASDGGIFAFGDAGFFGSTGAIHLNSPIVGMAATPTGKGYWLVAADGAIFSFGDASFFGSTGAIHLNSPIVGMARSGSGKGYWLVAADGGIFSFGDAGFLGSTGAIHLNSPIVAMATTPTGSGYWLVATDGGIFSFNAPFFGSTGAIHLNQPIRTMAPTDKGDGYWLAATDGGIFSFGNAGFYGSTGAIHLNSPIVGATASKATA
ncbi:MAG TPA: VCBS repeat-containing protein [Acidimicrobiales bacterium]|nr:VCBS repeat-containing protein [Acidimicrobiales bacterium]